MTPAQKRKAPPAIHLNDALRLLHDHRPHHLRLWKLSTGDILDYKGVTVCGSWRRGGLCRVRFPQSGQIRAFRAVSLFEMDGMAVYM